MKIEKVVDRAVREFTLSQYPMRFFDFQSEELELHIRVPPSLSEAIRARINPGASHDFPAIYGMCPAIERVEVATRLQGKGMFRTLTDRLLSLDGIRCVVASNVFNQSFLHYLQANSRWEPLIDEFRASMGMEAQSFLTWTGYSDIQSS